MINVFEHVHDTEAKNFIRLLTAALPDSELVHYLPAVTIPEGVLAEDAAQEKLALEMKKWIEERAWPVIRTFKGDVAEFDPAVNFTVPSVILSAYYVRRAMVDFPDNRDEIAKLGREMLLLFPQADGSTSDE